MKKCKIFWTAFADKALDEAKEYIQRESRSEDIATAYINKLIARVDQLEYFPESGPVEPLLKHLPQNSRYLVEGNYKIIYQYDNKQVIITDVFHAEQMPLKIVTRDKRAKKTVAKKTGRK
jgi:toxin ParE1/3/4